MENQDILTRSELTARFKDADIITRDYLTGVFYHQITLKANDSYLAIHENMPNEKKYFGRAWLKNRSMWEISYDNKEELFDFIEQHVYPSIIKKLIRKIKLFFKTTIQKLWNRMQSMKNKT